MQGSDIRSFPARMDAFPRVKAFIDQVCTAAGVSPEDRARLTLIVEELFTNTVKHGHGGDSESPVSLTLTPGAAAFHVVYEDCAPRHDPFGAVRVPNDHTPLEQRPVGGLGMVLVASLSREVHYEYSAGRNRVALTLALTAPPQDPAPRGRRPAR